MCAFEVGFSLDRCTWRREYCHILAIVKDAARTSGEACSVFALFEVRLPPNERDAETVQYIAFLRPSMVGET